MLGLGFWLPPCHSWLGCWGVCVGVHPLLVPRHSWLGCAVWVCVLELGFRLRTATPGWSVGVWVCLCVQLACTPPLLAGACGVCLGSGFGCALPLLAGVLGSVCVWVRAPPQPRHSWLGCAAWVFVLGLGFGLRPATPGCGVGVCMLVCDICFYPAISGSGLWCVGCVLPGTCSCVVVHSGLCELLGFALPGGRCCLAPLRVPWFWPAACLSGVPRSPASVRRASSGPVPLGAPVSFPDAMVPFPIQGSLCLPLAAAQAAALCSLRVVPVPGPAMGLSLAGPSSVGLGLIVLRWFGMCESGD